MDIPIYNENEDFYTSSRFKDFSLFDIVITNPPYSSNHKERCMKWLRKTKKPFFCLMWKFAANKKWYREGLSNQINTKDLYIYPKDKTRYDFKNPSGKGIHGGSPYVPLWFINTSSVINTSTILHMIPKVTALCIEIGSVIPPVGLNLFAVSGVTGLPVTTVIKGSFPFCISDTVVLIIVLLFPSLALTLPELLVESHFN